MHNNQRHVLGALYALAILFLASVSFAAPEAHILRIDPRTSTNTGNPVLTTIMELQQSKRVSQATAACATMRGSARLSCMAEALEHPLYSTIPFPKDNALFTVTVDGADRLAKLVSVEEWGKSQRQPGVGTAWLILIDADSRMGRSFNDAKALAARFISSMGPNDIVNLMFFNDRQVFNDSGWLAANRKNEAKSFIREVSHTIPKQGRNRPLLTIIKNAATDGFKALGNAGSKVEVPMHQAMVVLSTGFGGADPSTTGPGAIKLSEYMTNGRFPEDNPALPKTPVPVISVYFPTRTFDEFANNSLEFMENLANPQIGGFFNIMQAGESERAKSIVKAVRKRFSKMLIVKWRISCIAPSITQTFRLVFKDVNPPIIGDASFKDVPIGIDPTTWPLDVDVQRTQSSIGDGVYPGGTFKLFGDFCWGGDKSRAEIYFIPAGQTVPTDLKGRNPEQAKKAQQQLIAMGMRGEALQTTATFAEFKAPDSDKLLHGSGSQAVARFVVYDNKAQRMSGITADTILQVKARTAPFPLVLVLGGALGLVVVALVVVLVLSSGKKKPRATRPSPSPVQAAPAPVIANPAPAPVAVSPAPANVTQARIYGSEGEFAIPPNLEMKAGRDAGSCAILLRASQVSSVHATLKLENGQLFVRDEQSNNGSFVGGHRIVAGQWTPVPHGSELRLGPAEFKAVLE